MVATGPCAPELASAGASVGCSRCGPSKVTRVLSLPAGPPARRAAGADSGSGCGSRSSGRRAARGARRAAAPDHCARTFTVRPTTSSMRAQLVVVGVLHADPGVRHVAGLDGLRRRAGGGRCASMIHCAEPALDVVDAVVAGDAAVAIRAQRDDAGREAARRPLARAPVRRPPSPTRGRGRCRCRRCRGPTRARPAGGSRSRRT